ncbi:MAG: HEAT repeat domain-containing protein [Chloroflexaceae bacterium]|nr:HEAT repeat domain-containing protein [Chloroflexaceae bacterium]
MSTAMAWYSGRPTWTDEVTQQNAISDLVARLSDPDVVVRDRAASALVLMDRRVVGLLVEELNHPDYRMRLGAARVLRDRADPGVGPYFIEAMNDAELEVRRVAAEGLIALGDDGLELVLEALINLSWKNPTFREEADHVIRRFSSGKFRRFLEPVTEMMEGTEPAAWVPLMAYGALIRIHAIRANRSYPESESIERF